MAAVRPVMPAPTTATSTEISPSSRGKPSPGIDAIQNEAASPGSSADWDACCVPASVPMREAFPGSGCPQSACMAHDLAGCGPGRSEPGVAWRRRKCGMRLSYLVKGLPGHPLHPPLTDATIGIYTAAAVFGVLSAIGVSERNTATAWWLTLVIGLIVTVPIFFLLAAIFGHGGYVDHAVRSGSLIVMLIGFAMLTLGGWLGGSVVYVHGMRVLNLVSTPAHRAVAPVPTPEKEAAERT